MTGQESIDWTKPTLLIANHPNGFTEPILLATHLKPDLHFVTRSDVFTPKMRWFFKWTHQLPIYRFRDGFSGLRKNAEHLNRCADVIEKGGNLLIFGEGSTQAGKRIRPIQKGSARILQLLIKRGAQDVQVIPVSLTYTHPLSWSGQVIIRLHRAVQLHEFYSNDAFDVDLFVKIVKEHLISGSLHIEDEALLVLEEKQSMIEAARSGYQSLEEMKNRLLTLKIDPELNQKNGIHHRSNWDEHSVQMGRYAHIASRKLSFFDAAFMTIPKLLIHQIIKRNKLSIIFLDGLRVGGLTIYLVLMFILTIIMVLTSLSFFLGFWIVFVGLNLIVSVMLYAVRSAKRQAFFNSIP